MKLLKLLISIVAVTVLAGCYEIKQDEKGRTIKVNKFTGDLSVIEGDKVIKLKDEKEVKAEEESVKKLGQTKEWPVLPLELAGGTNVKLLTKWNGGVMYYQFYINKNLRGIGSNISSLSIQLQDNSSFLIQEIPIFVSKMTGTLGLDGKTIESMEYKGQEPISAEEYKKINEWNVTWAGFKR